MFFAGFGSLGILINRNIKERIETGRVYQTITDLQPPKPEIKPAIGNPRAVDNTPPVTTKPIALGLSLNLINLPINAIAIELIITVPTPSSG